MTINLLNQGEQWKKPLLSGYNTKRLKILIIEEDDFRALSEISMDLEIYTFIKHIKNGEEFQKWIKSLYKKRNYLFFSVKKKTENTGQTQQLVGMMILKQSPDLKIEFGGWIGKKFQKNGYASEIVKNLIYFTKKENKSLQLYAEIHKKNILARKVLIKTGFNCETRNHSYHFAVSDNFKKS